jgi:hypothetical protein
LSIHLASKRRDSVLAGCPDRIGTGVGQVVICVREGSVVLMELGLVEQRYEAVLEVINHAEIAGPRWAAAEHD